MNARPCQYHARCDSPTRPPRICPDRAEFTYAPPTAAKPFEVCRGHAEMIASVGDLRECIDPLPIGGVAPLDRPAPAC